MDGVALTVYNYAFWLQTKGGKVIVVTPQAPEADDSKEEFDVVRYMSVPIPNRAPYRMGITALDWNLHKRMKEKKFDLMHSHCPFSSGKLAKKIAKAQNVPLVATFHSKYRDDFKRGFRSDFITDYMISKVIEYYESVDEVWIPQASLENTIREYGYTGTVEVVNNGSDLMGTGISHSFKGEAKVELGVEEKPLVLLFVGQHIWEKNTALIIEALSLISEKNFKMFFVGVGYAKDEMMSMVNEKGLSEHVEFVGPVYDRETIKKYYAAADIFLFPSLYDNAPLVVREAATLQTPSILVSGSTAAEIITDGINGFLIENTAQSLAEKLIELYDKNEMIQKAGINASQSIVSSWEDIVDEVIDRYEKLIKRF